MYAFMIDIRLLVIFSKKGILITAHKFQAPWLRGDRGASIEE
jgi:hypothetical protein